ncbi:MAG: hypothetical protein FWC62_05880 [Firmicutes bacterium]|nr:hypothetical protein [Bacillota bacterium]
MGSYKIATSEPAEKDLHEIYRYISEQLNVPGGNSTSKTETEGVSKEIVRWNRRRHKNKP